MSEVRGLNGRLLQPEGAEGYTVVEKWVAKSETKREADGSPVGEHHIRMKFAIISYRVYVQGTPVDNPHFREIEFLS